MTNPFWCGPNPCSWECKTEISCEILYDTFDAVLTDTWYIQEGTPTTAGGQLVFDEQSTIVTIATHPNAVADGYWHCRAYFPTDGLITVDSYLEFRFGTTITGEIVDATNMVRVILDVYSSEVTDEYTYRTRVYQGNTLLATRGPGVHEPQSPPRITICITPTRVTIGGLATGAPFGLPWRVDLPTPTTGLHAAIFAIPDTTNILINTYDLQVGAVAGTDYARCLGCALPACLIATSSFQPDLEDSSWTITQGEFQPYVLTDAWRTIPASTHTKARMNAHHNKEIADNAYAVVHAQHTFGDAVPANNITLILSSDSDFGINSVAAHWEGWYGYGNTSYGWLSLERNGTKVSEVPTYGNFDSIWICVEDEEVTAGCNTGTQHAVQETITGLELDQPYAWVEFNRSGTPSAAWTFFSYNYYHTGDDAAYTLCNPCPTPPILLCGNCDSVADVPRWFLVELVGVQPGPSLCPDCDITLSGFYLIPYLSPDSSIQFCCYYEAYFDVYPYGMCLDSYEWIRVQVRICDDWIYGLVAVDGGYGALPQAIWRVAWDSATEACADIDDLVLSPYTPPFGAPPPIGDCDFSSSTMKVTALYW